MYFSPPSYCPPVSPAWIRENARALADSPWARRRSSPSSMKKEQDLIKTTCCTYHPRFPLLLPRGYGVILSWFMYWSELPFVPTAAVASPPRLYNYSLLPVQVGQRRDCRASELDSPLLRYESTLHLTQCPYKSNQQPANHIQMMIFGREGYISPKQVTFQGAADETRSRDGGC